jgi:hypothetical protein
MPDCDRLCQKLLLCSRSAQSQIDQARDILIHGKMSAEKKEKIIHCMDEFEDEMTELLAEYSPE